MATQEQLNEVVFEKLPLHGDGGGADRGVGYR